MVSDFFAYQGEWSEDCSAPRRESPANGGSERRRSPARWLLAAEFLIAVNGKIFGWSDQAADMAEALVIEAAGSICLISGVLARTAGAILCVYLGVVSVRLHDFGNQSTGMSSMNATQFSRNLGVMGGLLMIASTVPGSGPSIACGGGPYPKRASPL